MKIGDRVWTVGTENEERTIPCPDCLGQKAVTVILGDGTQVSIDCACGKGWDGPRGYLKESVMRIQPILRTITGIEINVEHGVEKIEYKLDSFTGGYYRSSPDKLFTTQEEAIERSKELLLEDEKECQRRLQWQKEDNRRTWAWNAHYHRDCLKRAQRDIEYHSRKLAVAKANQKEDKTKAMP